jgi:Icc-related predicted phosphoesterase
MPLFGRKSNGATNGSRTRIFFCTDVHGSTVCFKKFINAASFYGAEVLILGGDVSGKMVVPIARQASGRYLTAFAGQSLDLDESELAAFVKRAANMGFYPKVMDEDEFQKLKSSPEAQNVLFHELVIERLNEWVAYAEEKLDGTDVAVYAAPGNDDFFEVDEVLEASSRIELLELKVREIAGGYTIITSGWANRTPWDTERECSEEDLAARLQGMVEQVPDMSRAIFNLHVPPHDSKIDVCPKLDENLRVVYSLGNPVMAPAGSTAVRQAIEQHQPLLGLHGHIHEGRGEARLGRTVCLNPGSVYSEGVLNGVLVTLSGSELKDYQFTQG